MSTFKTQPIKTRTIGVTGFTEVSQIEEAIKSFEQRCKVYCWQIDECKIQPRLLVGILASSNTVKGIPDRFPNRYPSPGLFPELFTAAQKGNSTGICHYSTDTPENLYEECREIVELTRGQIGGFQLNIRWPDVKQMQMLRKAYPNLRIILQLGKEALYGQSPNDPIDHHRVLERVGQYSGLVNTILVDPSGGTGQEVQVDHVWPLVAPLNYMNEFDVAVASGLEADTLQSIAILARICPALGIVRDESDRMVVEAVNAYLAEAFYFFYTF